MKNNNRKMPRPAAMGYTCDAFFRNPNSDEPYLIRCNQPARFRLVLAYAHDCYAVKRCLACRDRLHREAEQHGRFEILNEEAINGEHQSPAPA